MAQINMNLEIQIGMQSLPNPVSVASGTFGFGEEYKDLTDYHDLGAVFTKAVTPERLPGNALPRLAETPAGLINAIGLANPGLDTFLREKAPILHELPCPAIVNVAGATIDDYVQVCEAMDTCDAVWGVELNVSCPNVDHGGMAFGTHAAVLGNLVRQVRPTISKPLIVKLSPNVTDITVIAQAAVDAGADALSCINTLTGMKVDVDRKRPMIPRGTGGLSGPAIRPVGVAAVWRVSKAVNVPVLGIGGITSAEDALEYLLAGASGVQIGTALFSEPNAPSHILQGIIDYMIREDFYSISDFHGHF